MNLYSLTFLFRFLPVFLLIYYLTPLKWRKYVLLLGSLLYVRCVSAAAVLPMLGAALVNWALSWAMGFAPRLCLAAGVAADLGLLLAARAGAVSLLGASFVVFSLLSYLFDVYRREIEPAPPVDLAAYAAMFPRLSAGPIARYPALADAVRAPVCTCAEVEHGLGLLIVGLAYKVLLADPLGGLWALAGKIGYESLSAPMAWLCAAGFSLQLYFDFQGYSLMAIGLGRMLGLPLPTNFDSPYAARSVSEFYRRWHITLGAWFRDYVYIPLGGSRAGTARTLRNLLAVWLLTGLWHGTTPTFVLWGLFLFVWVALEKLGLRRALDRFPVLAHVYVPVVILLSWVIFAVDTPADLALYYSRLFAPLTGMAGVNVNPADYLTLGARYVPTLLAGAFFALPFAGRFLERHRRSPLVRVGLLALFWFAVARLSGSASTPFLYTQF